MPPQDELSPAGELDPPGDETGDETGVLLTHRPLRDAHGPQLRPFESAADLASSLPHEMGSSATDDGAHRLDRDWPDDSLQEGLLEAELADGLPAGAVSPAGSILSGAGAPPSVQDSLNSSPGSSILPSAATRPGPSSPSPSFRPFDRRFHSRLSSSASNSPRASSPALSSIRNHRNASLGSAFALDYAADSGALTPPWEVVRWTQLKKIAANAFSEVGRRNFGSPTCLAVSTSIVLGTSKGVILIFDYRQDLKLIIGPGTKAIESGPVTSVAISADHTTVAGGHADGNIFTWDTAKASRPFLAIPPLDGDHAVGAKVDGHLANVAVLHLGFLGGRRTALVSADDRGMAFSHLATRGTGAIGRTVKTTRILGRYPGLPAPVGKPLKPSTVLAFAPLPLGTAERATDTMGLTAMLTPYLLVIVSTTPVAQTQHKSARPKDIPAHSAMTGCLAWYPATRTRVREPGSAPGAPGETWRAKLAYCWSSVLTVLEVEEMTDGDDEQPPSLRFRVRSRWKCEEAVVGVQWLSRSVLTVLTISQRLIVLEDGSMRMTEAFDLLQKHIYHVDFFSKQLHTLVEQLDEGDESMHGVVADAFYMSFKTYRGRLFLLGFAQVSIGALSNWADRLIALMEHGDYLGAIRLATSYFTGDAEKLTVGLPEEADLRQAMVREKTMEIMAASIKYAFGRRRQTGGDEDAETNAEHLKQLAEACFVAGHALGATDYLFEDMYDWYEDAGLAAIFYEALEPYILDESITAVPPTVVKDMVRHYVAEGRQGRLEEIICRMDTSTLDLDQVTQLCKKHRLYDALIYVWNQGLGDYITPLIELLDLEARSERARENEEAGLEALRIFPYLSYVLTGRVYPGGEMMGDEAATGVKSEVYWFLFSGKTIEWPRGSQRRILTRRDGGTEPAFPYLRQILKLDAPSFLSAMNEAFEDPFLNESPEKQFEGLEKTDLPEERLFGMTVDRQYIVTILLDILNTAGGFAPEDTIYLDMFVARNLPKFPQYLLFPGSTLNRVLVGLCNYPGEDVADDAQLSAEYLLSVYQPADLPTLMPLFERAGFYRILKRIFKAEKQYGKLLQTYFRDVEDRDAVFGCIEDCLRPRSGLEEERVREVEQVVEEHARELLILSAERTAEALAGRDAAMHERMLAAADDLAELQYAYLKALLEGETAVGGWDGGAGRGGGGEGGREGQLMERYIRLMCRLEPGHVSEYIAKVEWADLRLDRLMPTMEETGVVDAAVLLMARDGQIGQAMERLIRHLFTLESAMQGLLLRPRRSRPKQRRRSGRQAEDGAEEAEDGAEREEKGEEETEKDDEDDNDDDYWLGREAAAEEVLSSLQKYVHVGIVLCRGQTAWRTRTTKKKQVPSHGQLSADEALWLELIDACVQVTRRLSPAIQESAKGGGLEEEKLLRLVRSLVQHTFTALLTATSGPAAGGGPSKVSFLRVLKAFLEQAAASLPKLADLRDVLASIFSTYAYEESILKLSNRLLEQSRFASVKQAAELRQRGWRPRGAMCEACGRRVWGPGIGGRASIEAWEEWQTREEMARRRRRRQAYERAGGEDDQAGGEGKGKKREEGGGGGGGGDGGSNEADGREEARHGGVAGAEGSPGGGTGGPLVVLACRHVYHRSCLEALLEAEGEEKGGGERPYRCPIEDDGW